MRAGRMAESFERGRKVPYENRQVGPEVDADSDMKMAKMNYENEKNDNCEMTN